jgi:hypothetical protein
MPAHRFGNLAIQNQRQELVICRAMVWRHWLNPPKARSAQNVLIRSRIRYVFLPVIRLRF